MLLPLLIYYRVEGGANWEKLNKLLFFSGSMIWCGNKREFTSTNEKIHLHT